MPSRRAPHREPARRRSPRKVNAIVEDEEDESEGEEDEVDLEASSDGDDDEEEEEEEEDDEADEAEEEEEERRVSSRSRPSSSSSASSALKRPVSLSPRAAASPSKRRRRVVSSSSSDDDDDDRGGLGKANKKAVPPSSDSNMNDDDDDDAATVDGPLPLAPKSGLVLQVNAAPKRPKNDVIVVSSASAPFSSSGHAPNVIRLSATSQRRAPLNLPDISVQSRDGWWSSIPNGTDDQARNKSANNDVGKAASLSSAVPLALLCCAVAQRVVRSSLWATL